MLIWSLAPKSKFYSWKKKRNCEKYNNFLKFWVIFFSFQSFSQAFPVKFYDLVQLKKKNRSHTLILISSNHSFNESKASIKQHLEAGRILFSLELFIISKPHSTLSWGKPHYSTLHYEVLEIITVSFFCLSKLLYVLWFHLNNISAN